MIWILLAAVILAAIAGPGLWARNTLDKYSGHVESLPGTGGELARHLLDRHGLMYVRVEPTDSADHYDPVAKAVRLTERVMRGKSLTAVAVAAHEVGHALQDHSGFRPLKARTRLVKVAAQVEKTGALFMLAIPLALAAARSPRAGLVMFLIGLASMGLSTLIHVVTLPVEWDASFGRALPALRDGAHITEKEDAAVRKVLRACAMTYVASSLSSLLNFWRWIAVLRR